MFILFPFPKLSYRPACARTNVVMFAQVINKSSACAFITPLSDFFCHSNSIGRQVAIVFLSLSYATLNSRLRYGTAQMVTRFESRIKNRPPPFCMIETICSRSLFESSTPYLSMDRFFEWRIWHFFLVGLLIP